jgi:opacity protein-like surface antigen
MLSARSPTLLVLLMFAANAFAQTAPPAAEYSRLNSFGFFGEYSNDSSHIVLGTAENRKLLDFGGTYSRRVLLSRFVDGQYMLEVRPIMLESDPVFHETTVIVSPPPQATLSNNETYAQACKPFSETFTNIFQGVTYSDTETVTCGRRWTFGEGFAPVGFKWNFRPRHRVQPVFTTLLGYMFSTQQIPVDGAGSWNFTIEVGAGFEFYRSAKRSIRAEYRYHHISNDHTADLNPGIDNGLFQVTYAFGR